MSDGTITVFSYTIAVTVTVTGTAGVKESLLGLDSWIAAAEEVSLQTASEGGKRRCKRKECLLVDCVPPGQDCRVRRD